MEISLRHLTSLDSICLPTLSLAPISIMFDAISINSHWLETSYQVSRHGKHFKNISLLLLIIWSDPVSKYLRYLMGWKFDEKCKVIWGLEMVNIFGIVLFFLITAVH